MRVGVKNAVVGFGFQDTLTGEYSGLEISLAEKIAESLGVDVEFTAVTAATRTELLDSGDIDCVLATFTITDERKQSWDFSTPYLTDYVTVLVEDKSGISSLADLVDKKVGVSSGSTSAKALVKAMIDAGLIDGSGFDADTFDPALWTTGISFQQYDDYPAISTALSAGEVDAFCVDKSILAIYKTDGRSYIDDKFSPQEYGVATTKGSGFSAYVDELVQGWLADGTIDSLITENGLGDSIFCDPVIAGTGCDLWPDGYQRKKGIADHQQSLCGDHAEYTDFASAVFLLLCAGFFRSQYRNPADRYRCTGRIHRSLYGRGGARGHRGRP